MTRINVVPVEELTDNFLMAEYFELPRVIVLARKHYDSGKLPADLGIPSAYTLGTGHMKFFYDKMMYLCTRFYNLGIEGTKRNLVLQVDPDVPDNFLAPPMIVSMWWHDYIPTPEALQLNRDRLQVRRRYEGGSYVAK